MNNTREKWEGVCALCMSCKEWTDVLEPCCNSKLLYEGGIISPDDILADIEFEESQEKKWDS